MKKSDHLWLVQTVLHLSSPTCSNMFQPFFQPFPMPGPWRQLLQAPAVHRSRRRTSASMQPLTLRVRQRRQRTRRIRGHQFMDFMLVRGKPRLLSWLFYRQCLWHAPMQLEVATWKGGAECNQEHSLAPLTLCFSTSWSCWVSLFTWGRGRWKKRDTLWHALLLQFSNGSKLGRTMVVVNRFDASCKTSFPFAG